MRQSFLLCRKFVARPASQNCIKRDSNDIDDHEYRLSAVLYRCGSSAIKIQMAGVASIVLAFQMLAFSAVSAQTYVSPAYAFSASCYKTKAYISCGYAVRKAPFGFFSWVTSSHCVKTVRFSGSASQTCVEAYDHCTKRWNNASCTTQVCPQGAGPIYLGYYCTPYSGSVTTHTYALVRSS
jgi:hypothetical protein